MNIQAHLLNLSCQWPMIASGHSYLMGQQHQQQQQPEFFLRHYIFFSVKNSIQWRIFFRLSCTSFYVFNVRTEPGVLRIGNNRIRSTLPSQQTFFKMGQPRPLFIVYFRSFKTNITIFTTIYCEKYPSSMRCRELNPRSLGRESPPLTTGPGLPPTSFPAILTIQPSQHVLCFSVFWGKEIQCSEQ